MTSSDPPAGSRPKGGIGLIVTGSLVIGLVAALSSSPTVVLQPGLGEASWACRGSPRPWTVTQGSACTTAPVEAGATPPTVPQDAVETATDLHTLLDRAAPKFPGLRARRSLIRRSLRPHVRRHLPQPGCRPSTHRLHRTRQPPPDNHRRHHASIMLPPGQPGNPRRRHRRANRPTARRALSRVNRQLPPESHSSVSQEPVGRRFLSPSEGTKAP